MDTASDLIANIEGYQQLLTTLSLGVAAGTFAFLTQIIFHNSQGGSHVGLKCPWLGLMAIIIHFVSIIFGVLTKSALVSSVPKLHTLVWDARSATDILKEADLGHITSFAFWQIMSFALGMLPLLALLFVNIRLISHSGRR